MAEKKVLTEEEAQEMLELYYQRPLFEATVLLKLVRRIQPQAVFLWAVLFFENGRCYAVSLKPRPSLREGVKAQMQIRTTCAICLTVTRHITTRAGVQSGALRRNLA